jgi:hypothetical protein
MKYFISGSIMAAAALLGVVLGALGQTRVNTGQLKRLGKDGVLVQTGDGLKTAFPLPGFGYVISGTDAYLMGDGAKQLVLSEVPTRQADGAYILRYRPNPAVIAVYRSGVRLYPDQYQLVWTDPAQLPDRFVIPGSQPGDRVLVDYQLGTQKVF